MPSAPAAASARARSRDAIAATGVSRPACIAGIIFFTAKCETPSTPKRNMTPHPSPSPPAGEGKFRSRCRFGTTPFFGTITIPSRMK